MNSVTKVVALALAVAFIASPAAWAISRNPGSIDLQVRSENIRLDPGHAGPPWLNDNISLSALIENLGDEWAINVGVVFLYNTSNTSLTYIGSFNFSEFGVMLGPGGNGTATAFWDSSLYPVEPYVNYSLWVRVLNDTQLSNQSDPDQTNNLASTTVSFLPDVIPVVKEVTASIDDVIVGDTVRLLASLGNTGVSTAVFEPVAFYLDNESEPFFTNFTDIPPDDTTYVYYNWRTDGVTDGPHNVTVRVRDSSGRVRLDFKYRTNPYVWAVTVSNHTPRVGDIVTLNVTLKNNGSEDGKFVVVDFFLDASGVPFGNQTAPDVPTGQSTPLRFSWDTTGIQLGNHTVKSRVSGTSKEVRTSNITFGAELFADLAITQFLVSSNSPFVGETLTLTINITNLGERTPNVNTTLQILRDSVEPIDEVQVAPLAPGEFLVHTYAWATGEVTPIRLYLLAQVNAFMDFIESNDANNEMRVDLFFQGNIDMSVQSITFSRSLNQTNSTTEVSVGQTLWIWVNVANFGSLSSEVNTTLSLYLDCSTTPFKSFLLYPIAPGRNFTSIYNWDTSALTDTVATNHSIRAWVDPPRKNNDTNPENNQRRADLTVLPPVQVADLAVLAVQTSKSSVRYLETVMVTVTITNIGGKPASNVTVRFQYLVGPNFQLIGDQNLEFIQPGEVQNVTRNWTVLLSEGGNYTINVTIDPINRLSETNTSNNFGTAVVTVLPSEEEEPELRCSTPVFQPKNPKPGETVNFTVTITNVGNAPATNVLVILLVSGKDSGQRTVPQLAAGESRNLSMSWKAQSGERSFYFRITADGIAGFDSTSVPVEVQSIPVPAGSSLPILIVIVLLVVAVVAVVALGGRKKKPEEEE